MKKLFTLVACALMVFCTTIQAELPKKVKTFAHQIAKDHALVESEVLALLKSARYQQSIIDKMTRRAEKHKTWYQYRNIFLNQKRIDQGVEFWQQNQALLQKAEQVYGVDPAIIIAILGVETYYGKRTGNTRVLDALYTLAFSYPKRARFFSSELKYFIMLSGEAKIDAYKVTGSYAGAMGAPQFISSSYRNFAVDFDQDGRTDLWNSKADIIGSVASYFARHNWRQGLPVAVPSLGVKPQKHAAFFFSGKKNRPLKEVVLPKDKPKFSISRLKQAGISPKQVIADDENVYLLPFETADNQFDYWLGTSNFYCITRYNRSPMYAMAVYQLSQAIARKRAGH